MSKIPQFIQKSNNNNNTEKWVHHYLNNEGNNKALSKGLKKQKRYWLGPIKISLSKLHRCCGYESNMEYTETISKWNRRINSIIKKIDSGWDMPPLIVTYKNKQLSIRDGNHRYDALKKCNKISCRVIIWYDTKKEIGKGI
jgi:hypothetical protein